MYSLQHSWELGQGFDDDSLISLVVFYSDSNKLFSYFILNDDLFFYTIRLCLSASILRAEKIFS